MLSLAVKKNRIGPILGRHPWVFSGAFVSIPDGIEVGTPVQIVAPDGNFLASGYFNLYSQIAVRLWSFDEDENVDKQFFLRRIEKALSLRTTLFDPQVTNAYRLINAENDLLPGLIVDRYGEYLSVQFHTRGLEKWKELILDALVEIIQPKGIFERSDIGFRRDEGLDEKTGLLFGEVPERVEICENTFRFLVDIQAGQKTGFFLDQREKRFALMKYARDKDVLNTFCYSGGFSVYALAAGARSVTSVDISESALDLARENLKLNGFDPQSALCLKADVKQYLRDPETPNFDIIILDPPAFIKNRHKIQEGIVGYRHINASGMKKLREHGILVTCSCSHFLDLETFRFLLTEEAAKAKKSFQILEVFGHGLDHHILLPYREGEYLKTLFLRNM